MSNLIRRQDAIDLIEQFYAFESKSEQIALQIAMRDLPSAQPEPCEDAVSREVLKDGFTEMCNLICPYTKKQQHVMCGSCLMGTAFDVLEATPSVTPKQRTGKWIEDKGQQTLMQNFIERGEVWRVCSVCGAGHMIGHKYAIDKAYHDRHHNFCPHCGAKMEGENE